MSIWMYRDTVTRSWGPLSCHSSAAITSCFSMIMHGPMSQQIVHNSSMLKMFQFFRGVHTHQTPMCLTTCSNSSQYPVTSHSHWKGVGQHSTGHNQQPDQLYAKGDVSCCLRQMVVTPDTDRFSNSHPYPLLVCKRAKKLINQYGDEVDG